MCVVPWSALYRMLKNDSGSHNRQRMVTKNIQSASTAIENIHAKFHQNRSISQGGIPGQKCTQTLSLYY